MNYKMNTYCYFLSLVLSISCNQTENTSEISSICGPRADFQNVDTFVPKKNSDFTKAFIDKHQRPVGKVSFKLVGFPYKSCTGTLLKDDYFLTAGHCMSKIQIDKISVIFNYHKNKRNQSIEYKVEYIAEVNYKKDVDYAILKLANNPTKEFGYTKLSNEEIKPFDSVAIIQHPKGQTKQVATGSVKSVKSGSNGKNTVAYRYADTLKGSSGAGVLNTKGELIAIHTTGECTRDPFNSANEGMTIESIRAISKIL